MTFQWSDLVVVCLWAATVGAYVWLLTQGGGESRAGDWIAGVPAFRELAIMFGAPPTVVAASLVGCLILIFVFLGFVQGLRVATWGVILLSVLFVVVSFRFKAMNRARYLKRFDDQLPLVADQMVSQVRGGRTLARGLIDLPNVLPYPASVEMQQLAERARLSAGGVEEALKEMAEKFDSKHLALILSVFSIFSRQGGNIVEPVQKMSSSFKDIWRSEQQIRTATRGARANFWLFNIAIIFIFTFISLSAPHMITDIFKNFIGIMLFTVGVAIYLVGVLVMRSMMRPDL